MYRHFQNNRDSFSGPPCPESPANSDPSGASSHFYSSPQTAYMSHYSLDRKRAAVDIFRAAKRLRTEHGAKWIDPTSLASVAAGGASWARIYQWLKSDLSEEAQQPHEESRGRPQLLREDQETLLLGFAVATRTSLQPLALKDL